MSDESLLRNGLLLVKEMLFWPWTRGLAVERVEPHFSSEPTRRTHALRHSPQSSQITRLGGVAFLIQLGERRILVDPVCGRRACCRRLDRSAEELTPWKHIEPIDVIVVTHRQGRRMDSRSLQGLSRRTPVVVPTGLGEAYCWRGFNQVIELAAREQFVNGDLEVTALPAGHVTERRRSWRRGARSWSGFAIQVAGNQREREMGGRQEERPGGEALWFLLGGDEIPSDPVEELAEMFSPPRPDVILIPVDDRKPGWLTSRQGMRPEQALESFRVTGGRVFIPLPATWIQESAGRVNAIVTRIRAAWDCHPPLGKELVIPRPGETIEIPGR